MLVDNLLQVPIKTINMRVGQHAYPDFIFLHDLAGFLSG